MIYYASWQNKIFKKHTYIKLQQEMTTKSKYPLTHAITQNYKHSAKLHMVRNYRTVIFTGYTVGLKFSVRVSK